MERSDSKLIEFITSIHPVVMRDRLIIMALYICMYESMINTLQDNLKMLFSDDVNYKNNFRTEAFIENVKKLDNGGSLSKASMKFVLKHNGINTEDYDDFLAIKSIRDQLAHELMDKILGNFDVEIIANNQKKLIDLCIKIEKWWFNYFEAEVSGEEYTEEQIEGMITSNQMLYKLLVDVALGEEDVAISHYNEVKKQAIKNGYIDPF